MPGYIPAAPVPEPAAAQFAAATANPPFPADGRADSYKRCHDVRGAGAEPYQSRSRRNECCVQSWPIVCQAIGDYSCSR